MVLAGHPTVADVTPVAPDRMMRIAIYFSPLGRTFKPTGVGRHIVNMAGQLGRADGVEPVLLVGRKAYEAARGNLPAELATLPVSFLPGPEGLMRKLLLYAGWLPVDRWAGADWVYCPKEQPVTVRKSRLAVTIHDVLPFERDVPGYTRRPRFCDRLRWERTMARILKSADLIATVSQFTRQRLLSLFPVRDESRVVVVGNGVGEAFFRDPRPGDEAVLKSYGVESGRYVVVSGGLQVRKGADVILKLAEEWKRRHADLVILVTGRQHEPAYVPVVESLQQRPDSLPLRLSGYVPDEELAALLSHSLALAFPSRYEGFGLPTVEAMAAGTPVVFSPVGSLPEVIGDAGIPVPSGTAEEFDAVLRQLSDSASTRQRYIEAGRARARCYTWQECAARLLAAMRSR